MSVTRWEPFRDFVTLRQAMDRLFEDAMVNPSHMRDGQHGGQLPLDIYTTPDAIVIRASVAGVNPEEVDITVEGSTVSIHGEIKPNKPEDGATWLLQEQRYGAFSRTLDLAMPVQAEKADARFENGVLTLTIPKAEEIKPKIIKVKSK